MHGNDIKDTKDVLCTFILLLKQKLNIVYHIEEIGTPEPNKAYVTI